MARARPQPRAPTPQPPARRSTPAVRPAAGRAGARRAAATPQAPPVAAPAAPGANFNLSQNQGLAPQLNQPINDLMAGMAYGNMPSLQQNLGGQQQLGGMLGTGAAATLGAYTGLMSPYTQQLQQLGGLLNQYQAGGVDLADPMLKQQYQVQEGQVHDQLRAQLGPDYATSSAGAQALALFNQTRFNALASSSQQNYENYLTQFQQGLSNLNQQGATNAQLYGGNAANIYNQTTGLQTGQLANTGAQIANAGGMMGLLSQPAQGMANFGGNLAGQAGTAIAGQQPYQQDRALQAQMSTYPTSQQYMGMMMGQSGNRWMNVGNSMMGAGGQLAQSGGQAGGA